MISQRPRRGPLPRLGVCFIIAPDDFAGAHAAHTPLLKPPHGARSYLALCWQALISSGFASIEQDYERPHEGREVRSFFYRLRLLIRARVMAPNVAKTLAPIRSLRTENGAEK